MQTESAEIAATGDWRRLQCPRIGATPLRFKGRLIDWVEAPAGGAQMFIGLYQRKTGGYTIALCRLTGGGAWAPHAITTHSFEQALSEIEQYCCDLLDEVAQSRPAQAFSVQQLSREIARHGRLAAEVQGFRALAGQALDRWTRVCAAGLLATERS